jgi:arylsulfatase A-like enzyme
VLEFSRFHRDSLSLPFFDEAFAMLQRLLMFALSFTIPICAPLAAAPGNRPNVLFIAVDDLNHWVGHLDRNPQVRTPHIDALAARGVSFTRAYAAVPACEPSRCALLTGLRPWTSGCYLNGDKWKRRTEPGQGISAQFLAAGYDVVGAGKIYHGDTHFPQEWTEYMDQASYRNLPKVKKYDGYFQPLEQDLRDQDIDDWQIVDWCIDQLQRPRDKPLFLACGLHKPHLPFAVPRKYYEPFPVDQIQLPPYREDDLDDLPPAGVKMAGPQKDHKKFQELGRWRNAIRSYLATVAYTDMNVGRLLEALRTSPEADNTIILLWGDHGWSFGEKHHWRKFALWEEPTRTPLVWVAPGVTTPGTLCDSPVDLMTIYPTLCQLAGVAVPGHVQGKSAVPLLENPTAEWNEPAVMTHGYENHAVRLGPWRYIRYRDGSEELYNHTSDPYEWTNLAGTPAAADIIPQLRSALPVEAVKRRN